MPISDKKRILVFGFFLAIAIGAGFFLVRSIKDSANSDLPLQLASGQKEESDYVAKINSENGIDVRLKEYDDFGISLPKTLANPIRIAIPEYPAVEIVDQDETNRSAQMTDENQIIQNDQNAKIISAIKQDSNLAVYRTPDQRKSIFYAYAGNPSEKGKGQFKNWILYERGNGQETESFKIAKGQIVLSQNGDAKIYAEGRTDIANQNPDFTIPKPYFIDKEGQKTDLNWEFDAEKNTLTVKLTANQNQYPLALDPTIMYDATLFQKIGAVQMVGSVKVKTDTWSCGNPITYNGDTYPTVLLGTQCWFRENLRTTKKPDGVTNITRYCYTGDDNCTNTSSGMIYGGLYDWNTAMNGGGSGAQGICPNGWHIPTDAELATLFSAYTYSQLLTNSTSTFSGLLAGGYNSSLGGFVDRNSYGYWWSSTEYNTTQAWIRLLMSGAGMRSNINKSISISVRCLKDVNSPVFSAPAFFNFTDQTGVNPSTLTNSDIKQITGLSAAATVSISGDGSPEYRICADATCSSVDHDWSSSSGSLDNNQYLQLRLTSSAFCLGTNSATVVVGDGSNKWSVKTNSTCGCSVQGRSPDALTYGTVTGPDSKCWLDRNLGATQVATSSTDAASYGWLYQWGRLTDGHQIITSSTTATKSTADIPGHANFITNMTDPRDWRNPQNNNLWQGVSGTNNPCPTGFRLPTSAEWSTLIAAAPAITNAATAFSSTLKLSLAGDRLPSGQLFLQGSSGFCWSSSVSGTDSSSLYFNSSSVGIGPSGRVIGFPVRCVKD